MASGLGRWVCAFCVILLGTLYASGATAAERTLSASEPIVSDLSFTQHDPSAGVSLAVARGEDAAVIIEVQRGEHAVRRSGRLRRGRHARDGRRSRDGRRARRREGRRRAGRRFRDRDRARAHRRRGRRYRRRHRRGRAFDFGFFLPGPYGYAAEPYYHGGHYGHSAPPSGGSCAYWSDRCVASWGYRNPDYYGCLRYHGC